MLYLLNLEFLIYFLVLVLQALLLELGMLPPYFLYLNFKNFFSIYWSTYNFIPYFLMNRFWFSGEERFVNKRFPINYDTIWRYFLTCRTRMPPPTFKFETGISTICPFLTGWVCSIIFISSSKALEAPRMLLASI